MCAQVCEHDHVPLGRLSSIVLSLLHADILIASYLHLRILVGIAYFSLFVYRHAGGHTRRSYCHVAHTTLSLFFDDVLRLIFLAYNCYCVGSLPTDVCCLFGPLYC